jgi:hypothetical protein
MPATSSEVKQVLIKWNIDVSDWKKALSDITRQIGEVRKSDAAARSDDKTYLDYRLKQIRLSIGDIRSEVQERVKATRQVLNQVQQQKLLTAQATATKAQHQASTAALNKQKAEQQQVTAAAAATAAQQRTITAQIQAQTAALRLQALQQRLAGGGGVGGGRAGGGGGGAGGSGFLGGLLGGFSSRLAGTIGFSILSAEGLGRVFEQLYEKVKRFIEDSGPLEQLRMQFEKLGAVKGIDTVKFLEGLRSATHNLVNDQELFRTANRFMQSGIKASEDQIVALTRATVGLARAQGQDATRAIDALNRGLTTGNFRTLGYLIGISRVELQVRGLSSTMSDHARIQAQYENGLRVITQRYKEVGEPALTFTEHLKQLETITTRLFESFAKGAVSSSGMQYLLQTLDDYTKKLAGKEGGVETLGQKFGSVFFVIAEGAKAIRSIIGDAGDLLKTLIEAFAPKTINDDFITRLTTFSGLMKTAAGAAILVKNAFTELELRTKFSLAEEGKQWSQFGNFLKNDLIKGPFAGLKGAQPHGVSDLHAEFLRRLQELKDKEVSELEALEAGFAKKPTSAGDLFGKGGSGGTGDNDPNVILERRLAQLRMQLARDTAKTVLDVEKQLLQDEKDANEEAYQEGTTSFADYIARKREIREKELYNTLREIKAERDAEAVGFASKLKTGQIQPSEYALMIKDLNEKTAAKVAVAGTGEEKDQAALQRKVEKDVRDAADVRSRVELEEQQKTLQEAEKILDRQLKNAEVTVLEYSQRKKDIWAEELRVFNAIEEFKVKGVGQSLKQQEELARKKAAQAVVTRVKGEELDQQTPQLEIERSQALFDKQLKILEAQKTVAQLVGGKTKGGTAAPIQDLIGLYQKYIDEQAALLQTVPVGSKEFLSLADNIAKSTAEIIKLKEAMPSLAGSLSGFLSSVGAAFGSFGAPKSVTHYNPVTKTFGQTTTPVITQLQEGLTATGAYEANQAKYVSYSRGAGISDSPLTALGSTFKSLVTSGKQMGDTFGKFTEALTASISQIGTFVQALQGQGGPVQAGLTGLASGADLGKSLGGIMSQAGTAMGGAFGSVLSAAGPWGAAAGAAIGLISGVFGGKARKAAEKIAKQISDEINKSLKDFALQNTTLQQTIAALQSERQQAISQLSGKKGGRDQLDKILPQLDQQITQLQEQQKQLFIQMDKNLQIIGSPTPWQPLLQNIQSIIDTYRQYVNAGGDVNKANAFLKDSFANLQVTNMATLNQDMQDAINNALQYNDLLLQRQQYLAQTDQQIQDIIAAGAPTRMRTTAQTKMAQIEQIELQRNQQLQQMNEQITVAGYRLDAEKHIFNLATDRIGLETQLAQLQMQTINQDVARIAALKDLVTSMGGGSSSLIAAIIAAIAANPTSGTGGLDALLAALGLGPGVPQSAGSATGSGGTGSGGGRPGGRGGGGRGINSPQTAHVDSTSAGVAPNTNASEVSEQSWQSIYATRGRQGFGGFNGEPG